MTAGNERANGVPVESPIGARTTDTAGSAVCGARMEPARAYAGIPGLLQRVIDDGDEAAWAEILQRVDYIHAHVDLALGALDRETGFGERVQSLVRAGKRLVFKPNLVGPTAIHTVTHGEDLGAPICTDWTVIAALMRWFHDRLGIGYHWMALGEASTSVNVWEFLWSRTTGRRITTEAVFEGRSGDFYGGWGFWFVRRYLADRHPPGHHDDPMSGYEESVAGTYIPPGRATGRLMVYDLNRVGDDGSRGRTVPVPGGANFPEVTLHKVIVGGDPADPADLADYPGCVLVNVPKLKIHAQDLITNAIKNLGIGLYPVQCPAGGGAGGHAWKYALPSSPTPTYKARLPHMPWVMEIDEETGEPLRDEDGAYRTVKNNGMPGTQADVIRATQEQQVLMVHVSDAIDTINLNHNPERIAVRCPEGYLWSSLDPVALDLFSARYCFKTVPMAEGIRLRSEHGWSTEFVRHVPVARVDGTTIVSDGGLDSPLFRYNLYRYAERRGVGQQQYYVTGRDGVTGTPLASLDGHLGRIRDGTFTELMTGTMYHNLSCMLWDMQRTLLSYAEAHDRLTGSSLHAAFMEGFDENGDGMIDYDENGRKGYWTIAFSILSRALDMQMWEEYGPLSGHFYQTSRLFLKPTRPDWNADGHDFAHEYHLVNLATAAFQLSRNETAADDPFVPGMRWGRGMWPSWEFTSWYFLTSVLYGGQSTATVAAPSLYADAFQYADKTGNGCGYTGSRDASVSDPCAIATYLEAVSNGAAPLDFTLYVPGGYGSLGGTAIPNVEETADPAKVFTAHFNGGREVW